MAVRQLTPGASVSAPVGPLRVRLDAPPGVQLELRDEAGNQSAPTHRFSGTEAIVMPTGRALLLGAIGNGEPFPPGTLAGLSLTGVSGGDEFVRPQADIGGRSFAALVRLSEGPPSLLSDALEVPTEVNEPFRARSWHRVGSYAYHAHHDDFSQSRVPWAMVIDGSASLLLPSRRAGVGALLECVIGILGSAMGSAPGAVLVGSTPNPREVRAAIESDAPDWASALGDQPSPWSRVTPAIEQVTGALGTDGIVAVVTGGVPVDLEQLEGWVSQTNRRLVMIILGRSRREFTAANRPFAAWEDELSAIDPLAARPQVTVVSITDLAKFPDAAVELADAIFPVGVAR